MLEVIIVSKISKSVGQRIKNYRKIQELTLQQLANKIHKSRATLSKYENGEIVLDIETLYSISDALNVELNKLIDNSQKKPTKLFPMNKFINKSPFFSANRLYIYFYDGRYKRLKDGVIDIQKKTNEENVYEATLFISTITPKGRKTEIYCSGKVIYSDMLTRFSFVNQFNALEEDLLYIFNPLELRDFTEGLLSGISSVDLMPCAFKCLVTLNPQQPCTKLKQQLKINNDELKRWQKLNMMTIDNLG